jgi:Endoglucanase
MSNKTTQKAAVTWNQKTAVTSKAGTFTYKGTVKGYAKQVLLTLTVSPATAAKPRVVVNGKVNVVDGYLINGDYYFKPQDIAQVLHGSSKPFTAAMLDNKTVTAASVMIGNVNYSKIRDIAEAMNFSYTHDTVLDAAYIWTDELYADDASGDFNRAVGLGLVPDNLKTNTGRQITANEFRAFLSAMVGKLEPNKVAQFNKNVTTYDKPLLRGEGFVMAYYAAVCVGADTQNNDFDHTKADGGDFWDTSGYAFDKLFPHISDGPVKFSNDSNSNWTDYHTAAFLWSFWHSSPYSGYQVFEYDEAKGSMRQKDPLTVKEAVEAATRIYDSYAASPQYVSLADEKAVHYDKTIITDNLLNEAKALPDITKNNMPVWKGFVLSDGGDYNNTDIVESDKDLRNIADWGFNSVRFMLTYQTLFDRNVQSVNVSNLKKLDALIAAAIKYNLHIDILTFSLPGRWTNTDSDTYKTTGSLDLFTNPDEQKEANAVWALLADRYKDIPSATLSFCPLWEAQNHNLSSGLPVQPYTDADVANVYSQLIGTIKKYSPDRFIIYEPTANNTSDDIINESRKIKDTIESKYPDALMMANFCESPFVYAEMTAVQGDNIDNDNHSMFKPAYPTTIYATQYHIDNGSSLDMNGELVAGTKIDIYLSKTEGDGNFEITADGKTLYNERLSTGSFNVQSPLSGYYPYAKSDKLISVTLPSDVKNLQVRYGGNWFEWSGIDVTLPAKYTVKRWWFPSGYDAMLNGTENTGPVLKDTSTIMLSPNSYDSGRTITVNPDVTYTTSAIFAQSNKQTIENWAKAMSAYSPNLIVRFETASFNIGCIHDSALSYYDDMLSAFDKYKMSWFSNEYWNITSGGGNYAGVKPVQYNGFSLDVEMLKLLQKYQ